MPPKVSTLLDQFRKGSGEAPQYSVLAAGAQANQTAKYVQSFDERAIMSETPPTISGTPRGNPKRDVLPDGYHEPSKLLAYADMSNMRADNQVLVAETPNSQKGTKDKWPNKLRMYRDGET
jgi:hypothetical protein